MKAPTKLPCKVAVWWIYHVLGLSSLPDHLRLSSCSFSHSHQLDAFTPTHSISAHVSPWTCTPHKVEGDCSKSLRQTPTHPPNSTRSSCSGLALFPCSYLAAWLGAWWCHVTISVKTKGSQRLLDGSPWNDIAGCGLWGMNANLLIRDFFSSVCMRFCVRGLDRFWIIFHCGQAMVMS